MIHKANISGILISLGLLASSTVTAQERGAHNVYVEAGGAGIAYSVNYDTRFKESHNGLGFRGGLGFWTSSKLHRFVLPAQLNYLIGKRRHLLEVGAGATLLHSGGGGDSVFDVTNDKGVSVIGTISAGYRFQPFAKGINARAGGSLNFSSFGLPLPFPALSVGYTFPK